MQTTGYIRYSTTQGTNALVQPKGPRLGLLVSDPAVYVRLAETAEQRELLAALVGDRWAAVAIESDDQVLSAQLVRQINDLASRGASRVVVSVGGEEGARIEARLKRLLLRLYPRHLLGAIPLLFPWELAADRDGVRRTWPSVLNAFLHPAMERFLFSTENRLRAYRTRRPLLIFRNDGGSSRVAKSAAIKTYSSGPRGGLEGTRALAHHYGVAHMLMVDVGGTTTDVGVVADRAVQTHRRGHVDDAPTSFELAAITSHGVGGSSVIRLADGQLQVGPESVGAAPGPACFGHGGTDATITDVYLLMGILEPSTYLGGTLKLERRHAVSVGDDRDGLSVSEDVRELGGCERWVDRAKHRPGLQDRPPRLEQLEAVGQQHGDDVAGFDAELAKPACQLVGAGVELAVGDRTPAPEDEWVVRNAGCLRAQHFGNCGDRAHGEALKRRPGFAVDGD
ncbi:MAG: hydantoinase/oxoprolinase family protein [Solirubrobacteraceae bacterium]